MQVLTLADIRAAAVRIQPYIHRTPVFTSSALNALYGADLYFKCENLQKIGAFKIRGASNAVLTLSATQAAHGVATHSSGNHAAALALAARNRGIPAYVVMPSNAPKVKQAAVAGYGAEIVFCEPTLAARESALADVVRRTGAVFVPPYDDFAVIAGQGTVALELLDQVPVLDVLIAPVGGGGLLSGTALTAAPLAPRLTVIGAEPANADDAYRSLKTGKIQPALNSHTIADGLRTTLSELTFTVIRRHVEAIVTVSEEAIISAMRDIWERMKIVVEPSGAVPLAALSAAPERFAGKRVGLILSGGNVDLDHLPWLAQTTSA